MQYTVNSWNPLYIEMNLLNYKVLCIAICHFGFNIRSLMQVIVEQCSAARINGDITFQEDSVVKFNS